MQAEDASAYRCTTAMVVNIWKKKKKNCLRIPICNLQFNYGSLGEVGWGAGGKTCSYASIFGPLRFYFSTKSTMPLITKGIFSRVRMYFQICFSVQAYTCTQTSASSWRSCASQKKRVEPDFQFMELVVEVIRGCPRSTQAYSVFPACWNGSSCGV